MQLIGFVCILYDKFDSAVNHQSFINIMSCYKICKPWGECTTYSAVSF